MKAPDWKQLMESEAQRMSAIRMRLLERHAFWGYLLMQVNLVPALAMDCIMATDMIRHIWYNPLMTADLQESELCFVMLHEVCHQVQASNERMHGREPVKWNMATDYAINALLHGYTVSDCNQGYDHQCYQMPKGGLYARKYENMIAEVIYEDLCHQENPEAENETAMLTLTLVDDNGKDFSVSGVCDHHGNLDVHLPVTLTPDQQATLQNRVLAAVEHADQSQRSDDVPENLELMLRKLASPKVPWQRVLCRYVDTVINTGDYSLVHPNKHYWAEDLVVPGTYGETIASLVVAVDSSGSMSEKDLRLVMKEISALMAHAEEVTVIIADARVRQVIPFEELDKFLDKPRVQGRGGTDHRCVFEYIQKHHLNPRLFIGMSDLYSCFPKEAPPYPVLWLAPPYHGDPPWGRVLEVDREDG